VRARVMREGARDCEGDEEAAAAAASAGWVRVCMCVCGGGAERERERKNISGIKAGLHAIEAEIYT